MSTSSRHPTRRFAPEPPIVSQEPVSGPMQTLPIVGGRVRPQCTEDSRDQPLGH